MTTNSRREWYAKASHEEVLNELMPQLLARYAQVRKTHPSGTLVGFICDTSDAELVDALRPGIDIASERHYHDSEGLAPPYFGSVEPDPSQKVTRGKTCDMVVLVNHNGRKEVFDVHIDSD